MKQSNHHVLICAQLTPDEVNTLPLRLRINTTNEMKEIFVLLCVCSQQRVKSVVSLLWFVLVGKCFRFQHETAGPLSSLASKALFTK
jgi:hypothetical protein